MKINRKTLSLIIASLCGTSASAYAVGQDVPQSSPLASSGRIADNSASGEGTVGSDPRMGNIRSMEPSVPFAQTTNHPVSFQPAEFHVPGTLASHHASSSRSCESGSGCESMASCGDLGTSWVETEAILWWGKGFTNTPLIMSGNTPGGLPVNVLSGGEDNPVGNEMFAGMRVTAGKWLDCDKNYGLQGRVYGLFGSETSQTFGNTGVSNGVAYFDVNAGPSFYLVNLDASPNGANTGTITESTDLNFIGADASLRTLMIGDSAHRIDLLTGYTFMRLDSGYTLETSVTDGITNPIQNGTVIVTRDNFGTKNTFHGGHIGFASDLTSGRFTMSLLGKVALGNMEQRTQTSGFYSETPPNSPAATEDRGLFAQPQNSGTTSRDRFTFLPEAGAKLKYRLGRGQIGVGYTLLVMPNVALAADQIDTTIDFANINGVMSRPLPRFQTDTYFLHGLDLGYTVQF
ncbi:hypothetical protein VN12_02670 [Pirellula sp. SH-Sr6A]|uniref:BBP7 family outer membrane beta-barrel protein n=1 Tax=Pirellula sp. SH-Sr6A TaxID=1632865 RepID=UPI00078D51A2|nr:BBP7 family outer membrane beta-barrel protein [Pirellula sp. SH-Sr6A]AMV30991.1 hypothetical protein VN12_02670 [Pirellula sp. SH-Sr6A]